MAVLWAGPDPLSTGAFGQDNRLHAPGSVVFDFVVGKSTHQLEANFPGRPFRRSRLGHGLIGNLVGALPPGNQPSDFYVPEPNRADPRRKPGCLVLPEQTRLAI